MLRKLLTIATRVGRPGTLLELGDSCGRVLYLSAGMGPLSIVVGLERDDVRQLHAALSSWLREREDQLPSSSPAPLVAGRIGAGLRDVSASTVQFCTDAGAAHRADLDGSAPAV